MLCAVKYIVDCYDITGFRISVQCHVIFCKHGFKGCGTGPVTK